MEPDSYLKIRELPELREPILLAAFAGWNDAAQAATSALLTLCRAWQVERFADIEPEDFFVFTETRPTVSLDATQQRSLSWPANRFFACRMQEAERDIVLLIGTEPQLKWQTFCGAVLELAQRVGAGSLITLGALLADVPHTMPPRLSGFANAAAYLPELEQLDISLSSYQGPTGIVGALNDAWRHTGKPAFSLWGNVPHYVSASPNPQVSLALLRAASSLVHMSLPIGGLDVEAQRFRRQIDEAVSQNPEATEYVRQLEAQYEMDAPPEDTPNLLEDLESFLRSRRPPGDEA